MNSNPDDRPATIFISYASRDQTRVIRIAQELEQMGHTVWRDADEILGGQDYGPAIVHGIASCKVVLVMCTQSAMSSRNVRQEIKLAWHYRRPYLPLLLDGSITDTFPKQVQYWLEGSQWIDVHQRPAEEWIPDVARALKRIDIECGGSDPGVFAASSQLASEFADGLRGLRKAASFTSAIQPIPAESVERGVTVGMRGLGAAPTAMKHGYPLGSRVRLSIKSEHKGHLLLLDEGPEGTVYCLCPSLFAPDTKIEIGRSVLPQPQSPYDAFIITGVTGREQLLAIICDQPWEFDWQATDMDQPARVLNQQDIDELLSYLRKLEADRWTALSTYFDITA